MALGDRDDYIVIRDASESERLDHQHRLFMQCQGYHLHPDIDMHKGARVADLATGTAIWLREVAQINTTLECHGFDVSDAMYPSDLPENIKLHVQDVKKPFDGQWHGYFDAVNIRFIQGAMTREDWPVVLRNIVQILKPGGWLQWGEVDITGFMNFGPRPLPPDTTPLPPHYTSSQKAYRPPRNTAIKQAMVALIGRERMETMAFGFRNLEEFFSDPAVGDLDDVFTDQYATDAMTSTHKEFSLMLVNGMGSLVREAERHGKLPFDWPEVRSKALKEIELGAYAGARMSNFIGRRKT